MIRNGKLKTVRKIENSNIVVDYWKSYEPENKCVRFMTSLPGDPKKIQSAICNSSYKIYTTDFNKWYLCQNMNIDESRVVAIPYDEPYDDFHESTGISRVTAIRAHHCVGSAMFLFQVGSRNILYTGFFRPTSEDITQIPAIREVVEKQELHELYFDNTYAAEGCEFPKRADVVQDLITCISDHPNHQILISTKPIRHEEVLVDVAQHQNEKVCVSQKRFEFLYELGYGEYFTVDENETRIRVLDRILQPSECRYECESAEPRIVILLTALYYDDISMAETLHEVGLRILPYSTHSGHSETMDFISSLKPHTIIPIIKRNDGNQSFIVPKIMYDLCLCKKDEPVLIIDPEATRAPNTTDESIRTEDLLAISEEITTKPDADNNEEQKTNYSTLTTDTSSNNSELPCSGNLDQVHVMDTSAKIEEVTHSTLTTDTSSNNSELPCSGNLDNHVPVMDTFSHTTYKSESINVNRIPVNSTDDLDCTSNTESDNSLTSKDEMSKIGRINVKKFAASFCENSLTENMSYSEGEVTLSSTFVSSNTASCSIIPSQVTYTVEQFRLTALYDDENSNNSLLNSIKVPSERIPRIFIEESKSEPIFSDKNCGTTDDDNEIDVISQTRSVDTFNSDCIQSSTSLINDTRAVRALPLTRGSFTNLTKICYTYHFLTEKFFPPLINRNHGTQIGKIGDIPRINLNNILLAVKGVRIKNNIVNGGASTSTMEMCSNISNLLNKLETTTKIEFLSYGTVCKNSGISNQVSTETLTPILSIEGCSDEARVSKDDDDTTGNVLTETIETVSETRLCEYGVPDINVNKIHTSKQASTETFTRSEEHSDVFKNNLPTSSRVITKDNENTIESNSKSTKYVCDRNTELNVNDVNNIDLTSQTSAVSCSVENGNSDINRFNDAMESYLDALSIAKECAGKYFRHFARHYLSKECDIPADTIRSLKRMIGSQKRKSATEGPSSKRLKYHTSRSSGTDVRHRHEWSDVQSVENRPTKRISSIDEEELSKKARHQVPHLNLDEMAAQRSRSNCEFNSNFFYQELYKYRQQHPSERMFKRSVCSDLEHHMEPK